MRVKTVYILSKEEYKELKEEEYYGCSSLEQYCRETSIEDPDLIINAETQILIE